MNNNIPVLFFMVGLPASGKSTYAKELSKNHNAIICSSDEIRKELCEDENSQDKNNEVFITLHRRIKECLKSGKNVIYDSTGINSKRRKAFLGELKNIYCKKVCVIMATRYEDCLKRNALRDRVVPKEVITRMYLNWNTPYYFEGWDNICIKYDTKEKDSIYKWLSKYKDYNQDNPHHSKTLKMHCISTQDKLDVDNLSLYFAGLIHDCGKPFTKTFVNSKGEITDVAHYYNHDNVGAYNSLFFKYIKTNPLKVSILVNLHMKPYNWENDMINGEKIRLKYKNLWGEKLYNDVMELHKADVESH